MAKASKAKEPAIIKLDTYIDENDQLRVSFLDPTGERIPLRPDRGLQDAVAGFGREGSLTLEVRDFFQRGTVYEVYGAILEENGRDIHAYWKPTGNGQQYTFTSLSRTEAAKIKLVIGALPRRKDAVVPVPLAPRAAHGSDPFPDPIDPDPKGPTQAR
jgi:hypothetical protein